MARCLGCNFTHICITAMAVPNNFFVCSCCQDVQLEDAHVYVSRSIFNHTFSIQLPVSITSATITTIAIISIHIRARTRMHARSLALLSFWMRLCYYWLSSVSSVEIYVLADATKYAGRFVKLFSLVLSLILSVFCFAFAFFLSFHSCCVIVRKLIQSSVHFVVSKCGTVRQSIS
jgi:hypothetical protein